MTSGPRTTQITRGSLVFPVIESGPPDGEPVLLLHGFPQHADSWDALVPLLNDSGYRTLAMTQRGYTPGARPVGRGAYRITELVEDAAAVIDHYGGSVHVVGHDWGSGVAWALTAAHPERVRSLTAVSVPHVGAFLRAMVTSVQGLKSWYMLFFQLPWLPERLMWPRFAALMERAGQSPELAARDAAGFTSPAELTPAINWYRAMPLVDPRRSSDPVRRPTLLVWSDGDMFVDRHGVDRTERFVEAPYQLEVLRGVSHWIADEAPMQLAAVLIPHLKRWS